MLKRPMTTEELFNEIRGILKEKGKLPDILDYGLAAYNLVPIRTYEFDLKSNLISIRDFEKTAGLEEVARCIMLVSELREEKLLYVLKRNPNLFLYQKCGYILEQLREELPLSNAFFQECEKHFAATKRSLLKDSSGLIWNPRWHLYAPKSLGQLLNKGVSDYDAV